MLIEQEDYLRAGLFFAVLIGMACWEVYAPKRKLMITKWLRWQNNLALTIINSILLKIWLPVTATEVAAYAAGNQWRPIQSVAMVASLVSNHDEHRPA